MNKAKPTLKLSIPHSSDIFQTVREIPAVDVARRYLPGLRPVDAARMIARDFGIPVQDNPQEAAKARQRAEALRRQREAAAAQARRETETYVRLAGVYRRVCDRLAGIRTPDDLDRYGDLYHISTILEHVLESLRSRDLETRQAALAEARRWLS